MRVLVAGVARRSIKPASGRVNKAMNTDEARRTLLEVGGILDAHEVPFFFVLGTCLGFHREGNFIKHDKDIDLGVLVEHLTPKADALAKAFQDAGYYARTISSPLSYPWLIKVRNGVTKKGYVDIVGLSKRGQHRFFPKQKHGECVVYPARLIEDLEEAEYFGRKWKMPKIEYARYHYGPGWRKPDPNYKPTMGKARVYGFLKRVC